jgi:hypothetical protein
LEDAALLSEQVYGDDLDIHMLGDVNEVREDVMSEVFADPTRWLGNGSRMAGGWLRMTPVAIECSQ